MQNDDDPYNLMDRKEENLKEEEEKEEVSEELPTYLQIPNQNRLISNNMLFIIPSWSDLTGYNTLGKYANKDVAQILTDIVIFFGCVECSIQTERGTLHIIFGLGNYYTKFGLRHETEIQLGKYIIDNKRLTCLVLSDFVYDYIATSSNITLEDDKDVIVAESVIKIPIDLSFKSEGQQTMIKGIIMRNVFIPYKDIILETMDKIKSYGSYNIEQDGHLILNTDLNNFNKIIVSSKLNSYTNEQYMKQTAGINEITYGADEFLSKILSPIELNKIKQNINNLKQVFSTTDFDPMYPYSMLQNASVHLKSKTIPLSMRESSAKVGPIQKTSILFSAENRVHSLVGWPRELERKEKPIVEKISSPQPIMYQSNIKQAEPSSYEQSTTPLIHQEPTRNDEQFQLRMEKSEKVEIKTLPIPPMDNLENILIYIRDVIEQNFDMPSIGRAFGLARDNLKILYPVEHHKIKWELSKFQNIYEKKERFMGISPKDKKDILERMNKWIKDIEEERRKEQERLERERLERERKEREERERLKRNRIEAEKMERERLKQEQYEKERQIKIQKEQERLEQERRQKEAIEKEKQELKTVKTQIKLENKRKKQEKKLEKKKKKLEKKKRKEQERLTKLKHQ